ncbi:MAG TPA: CRISPR-associated endonuclease Cas1, partial [Verrucomicrobiota bacterium]|nr:CRISPR-associated endonuclease Cas1 [Verrucomicrobiota bacterium]
QNQCLKYAAKFVFGKIRNQRTMLMRNHLEPPKDCIRKLKQLSDLALTAKSTQELLGIEGIAANLYFENFNGMIKAKDELDILQEPDEQKNPEKTTNEMTFDFKSRNRRPPTDPVNALLSLAYSLLAKDCTIAALAVGFDPYIGFYHRPRFGRPALALDLMEEFRPIIAESVVITAINNRMLNQKDFVKAGKCVNLNAAGRKKFFYAYEQRMNTIFTHPIFDYKITYRRALEIQARLLAKTLTDEISEYVPIIVR